MNKIKRKIPTQHCYKCGNEKSISDFHNDATVKSGLSNICIACKKEYNKQHNITKKDELKEYASKWKQKNPKYWINRNKK